MAECWPRTLVWSQRRWLPSCMRRTARAKPTWASTLRAILERSRCFDWDYFWTELELIFFPRIAWSLKCLTCLSPRSGLSNMQSTPLVPSLGWGTVSFPSFIKYEKKLKDSVWLSANVVHDFMFMRIANVHACHVTQVDQIIMAKRAGGPKPRDTSGGMDQDDD